MVALTTEKNARSYKNDMNSIKGCEKYYDGV